MLYMPVLSILLACLLWAELVSSCAKRKACSLCRPGFVQLEADEQHGQQNLTTVLGPLDNTGCATLSLACAGRDSYIKILSPEGFIIGVSNGAPAVATLICGPTKEWFYTGTDNSGNPGSSPVANAICYDGTSE